MSGDPFLRRVLLAASLRRMVTERGENIRRCQKTPGGELLGGAIPKSAPEIFARQAETGNYATPVQVFGDFNKVLPGTQVNFFIVFAAISAARRGTSQKIIRRWRSSVNFFRIRPSILVEFCPIATGSAQHAQQNPKRAQHWRSSENISAQKASVLFSRKFNTNRIKKSRITPQILRTVLTIGQPLQTHCKWTHQMFRARKVGWGFVGRLHGSSKMANQTKCGLIC